LFGGGKNSGACGGAVGVVAGEDGVGAGKSSGSVGAAGVAGELGG
jgi:hypothetical protein